MFLIGNIFFLKRIIGDLQHFLLYVSQMRTFALKPPTNRAPLLVSQVWAFLAVSPSSFPDCQSRGRKQLDTSRSCEGFVVPSEGPLSNCFSHRRMRRVWNIIQNTGPLHKNTWWFRGRSFMNTAILLSKSTDQIKTECMYVRTKKFFRKCSEPKLKNGCCCSVYETNQWWHLEKGLAQNKPPIKIFDRLLLTDNPSTHFNAFSALLSRLAYLNCF